MPTVDELLDLSAHCYAQARASSIPLDKARMIAAGDEYLRQAVDLQIDSAVVYAAFPKRE